MKKVLVSSLCLLLLAFLATAALGQDLQNKGVVSLNGGSKLIYVGPPHKVVVRGVRPPSRTIFSNFNSVTSDLYNCCSGYAVSDGTTLGVEFTEASAFTAKRSAAVHSITVGMGAISGTAEAYVEFRKDCSGLPCGVSDWKKGDGCRTLIQVSEEFGQCCQTVTAKCKSSVKKGKQYWVVLEAKTTDNTETSWDDSSASNGTGNAAYDRDDAGWTSRGTTTESAFSVQ